mgnify:CR=1 FL=1
MSLFVSLSKFVPSALALAAVYLYGVWRLRRRGDGWPVGRTVSWLAGCAALLLATSSGVRSYGSAMFSVHMVEHMTLNMFVPVLLVLGAPVTLAVLPSALGLAVINRCLRPRGQGITTTAGMALAGAG